MSFDHFQETEIRTIGQFLDQVTPTEVDPNSGRRRDYSVYRGDSDATRPLLTSLDKLGGISPPHTKAHLEEHILRNFIRYSRPYLHQTHAIDWELLVIAQHHGLPTRLLDWTYSPLVAANFATLGSHATGNRVLWKLNWKKLHVHFKLRPIAFLVQDLDRVLEEKGISSPWDLFTAPAGGESAFACMLEPPALDSRLVAQSATFTLCSDKTKSFDQILIEHGLQSALRRFVIPADRVDLIRDQLDLCAIDERRLFPDLDGVAAEMKRYYSSSARFEAWDSGIEPGSHPIDEKKPG
ncbi:MAG: FRG domain-containing protein [Acidobacteria bacterium]|nr:MAG: FRG domain-containing protein [Acidobacteriota bacterium]